MYLTLASLDKTIALSQIHSYNDIDLERDKYLALQLLEGNSRYMRLTNYWQVQSKQKMSEININASCTE